MFKKILSIIIMAIILFAFLTFVNVSAVYMAIDVYHFNIALFVITCIFAGITLLFSDIVVAYLCVMALIESVKDAINYARDIRSLKNLNNLDDDKYDPHTDYH